MPVPTAPPAPTPAPDLTYLLTVNPVFACPSKRDSPSDRRTRAPRSAAATADWMSGNGLSGVPAARTWQIMHGTS